MATAQLYLRRFYLKNEIRRTNPYLVVATAVYLACKMEECPHHIRLVVGEGRTLWPGKWDTLVTRGYANLDLQITSSMTLVN
jgi:cyclin C